MDDWSLRDGQSFVAGDVWFALEGAQRLVCNDGWMMEKRIIDHYVLITVAEGRGQIGIDGRKRTLFKGKAFLLSPGSLLEMEMASGWQDSLVFYEIAFSIWQIGEHSRLSSTSIADPAFGVGFSCDEEILAEPFSKLLRLVEEIHARETISTLNPNPIERIKTNGRLQGMIAFVLESCMSSDKAVGNGGGKDSRRAVERSIAYLRESYTKDIGITEMAGEAGVGRSQYTRLFRELTGKSPVAFMIDLRIERAKELLATSGGKLREVAKLSGFHDEYYFNRRFKQSVGLSPKQYMHSRKDQLKVFCTEYLGELLALGVRPVAAARYLTENIADEDKVPEVTDIRNVYEELATIIGLKPDLILLRDEENRISGTADSLSRIAPVVKVVWKEDVFAHVRAVANIIGRERVGEDWIRRYEYKAARARLAAQGKIAPGETAALLGVFDEYLYIFADRNVGHTFYHVFGFEPPSAVKQIIADRVDLGGRRIVLSQLSLFDSDRLFVMVDRGAGAQAQLVSLTTSSEWKQLNAVRRGKVERLNARWHPYDANTLDWEIDEALKILTGGR
jgi:AraC-like DNA-binding protein/ABC-type Fe3+-hydroxamate transport system substrate-binding protein